MVNYPVIFGKKMKKKFFFDFIAGKCLKWLKKDINNKIWCFVALGVIKNT